MIQRKTETNDKDDKHGSSLTEECYERTDHDDGSKKAGHDNHRLKETATTIFTCHLRVEIQGKLIVYGQLHQYPESKTAGKEEAGEGTQQRQLALSNRNEHDNKRQ